MSRSGRVFGRNGHTYTLYEIQEDPEWNLFEDFGNESALVGSITHDDSQFRIECYWKPEPAARIHNIDARTLDEAVHALLDLAAGEDPRGRELHVRSDPPANEAPGANTFWIQPPRRAALGRAAKPGVEPVEGRG
ncbi:hypothetical protein [Leifsonia sp. EB34]|uniref:hypothetical protein n=1 Tax=Leifsonia sp. EB34 TaxID=3156303 RepID=UPI003518F354